MLRTPNEPSCLAALFLGKADVMTHLCKRLILEDKFEPVWIRSPDSQYWIYSLSNPTQVTVQCGEAEPPFQRNTKLSSNSEWNRGFTKLFFLLHPLRNIQTASPTPLEEVRSP